MRIEYTLPALEPDAIAGSGLSPVEGSGVAETGFRGRLRSLRAQIPENWRTRLGLDTRPLTAGYVGPPPRPATLEINDVESGRRRWRHMLQQHAEDGSTVDAGGGTVDSAANRMLQLLLDMQDVEDAIVARHLSCERT